MRDKTSLFRTYPIDGEVIVAGEVLPTPYHVHDGTILMIAGTGEAAAVSDLLAREGLHPITDTSGRALMSIALCDFAQASLGAHHELQISLLATTRPATRVRAETYAVPRAMLCQPGALMVCHGLWNNTERVVRYNREHLALDARLAASTFALSDGAYALRFRDGSGAPVFDGRIARTRRQSGREAWRLMRQFGLAGTLATLRVPFVRLPVVNTRRTPSDVNLIAQTYTRSQRQTFRPFGPGDEITLSDPTYAALDFRPEAVLQYEDIGFVYLRPEPLGT